LPGSVEVVAAIQGVTGLAECASFLETINYDLPNARAPHRTLGARGRERRRDLALRCRGARLPSSTRNLGRRRAEPRIPPRLKK
jgi:hypothetical protein